MARYGGGTLSERLAEAGLLSAFDAAARALDRDRMMDILRLAEVDDPASTVDAILADPRKYGYR